MNEYSDNLESGREAIEANTTAAVNTLVGIMAGKGDEALAAAVGDASSKQALELVAVSDKATQLMRKRILEKAGDDVFDRLANELAAMLCEEQLNAYVHQPIALRAQMLAGIEAGTAPVGQSDYLTELFKHGGSREIRLTTQYNGIAYDTGKYDELYFETRGNEIFAEAAQKVLTDAKSGETDWEMWQDMLRLVPSKLVARFSGSSVDITSYDKTIFTADAS